MASPPATHADDAELIVPMGRVVPMVAADNFDRWVFPDEDPFHGVGLRTRQRLTNASQEKIDEIDRCCVLSEDQKHKLQLAARADIGRLFDRVDAARIKFNQQRMAGAAPQKLWQDAQKLSEEIRSFRFGSGSMFRKTMLKTLTSDQAVKLRDQLRAGRLARHRANISQVLSYLERGAILERDQRNRILELIEAELPAPTTESPQDVTLVIYRVSGISETKLKPLLTADQWDSWNTKLSRFRGQRVRFEQMMVRTAPDDDLESLQTSNHVQTR